MNILSVVVVYSTLELFGGVNGAHWWCKRQDIGLIEHGTFTYTSANKDFRQYQCEKGYVSNIPDLSKIIFNCNIGRRKWEAYGVKIASTKEKFGPSDITCHKKVMCDDPPSKQELSISEARQYQLKMKSDIFWLNIREPQYFSGDARKYSCAEGFEETIDFAAKTYDTGITTQTAAVSEITCDNSGLWNGLPTDKLDLINCSAIICDASEYINISNGNITNYKDKFGFFETMRLTCDDGYRAKGGITSLPCFSSTSFTVAEFGCKRNTCLPPVNPVNGRVKIDVNKAYFYCYPGTKLIGQKEWTCQADGSWDSNCVVCDDPQSYCSPPCIPLGAQMNFTQSTFYISSTVVFTCSWGYNMVQSVTRTCMSNRAWSGKSIHCIGKSRNDPFVGQSILSAMERTFSYDTGLNETTVNGVQVRSIKVHSVSGVDVYFLIEVSSSIDENKMKLRKQFIKALLPKLGISDDSSRTRLALYFFASKTKIEMNDHYADDDQLFKNYKDAQEYIDNVNLTHTRYTTSSLNTELGTAITTALEDVAVDIMTKTKFKGNIRRAQQVLIVISDGQYNTNGDPTEVAKKLKQQPYDAEIYSIMISNGDKNDAKAFQAMKNIASNKEDEQHFFEIHEEDLSNIIDSMIGKGNGFDGKCGVTKSSRTKLANGPVPVYEHYATRHAWPWMAQLVGGQANHLCGGSLIDKQWILTAAHCIDATTKVYLKRLKMNEQDGFLVFQIDEKHKFKHRKYNEFRKDGPKYLYDVGLIKLPEEVVFSRLLLPVCLPNNATEDLFKAVTFGVVTGWGHSQAGGQYSETLKQMQMSIKDCSKKSPTDFDPKRMFCAGDEDEGRIIDSCQGDSGGPFSVRKKTDEDSFVQIGIVSHGKGCKTNDKNGIYTKLTSEIVDWIHEKINVTAST